jgi:hypothetical protein
MKTKEKMNKNEKIELNTTITVRGKQFPLMMDSSFDADIIFGKEKHQKIYTMLGNEYCVLRLSNSDADVIEQIFRTIKRKLKLRKILREVEKLSVPELTISDRMTFAPTNIQNNVIAYFEKKNKNSADNYDKKIREELEKLTKNSKYPEKYINLVAENIHYHIGCFKGDFAGD